MQLWSRGIPGGLVDAVSWPVVCNHSPTSHFVKGIHHWRQKSNLQAAMSIWAIGFKWAIPRKCHAFLGLGVFKTTVLVGEYFLNLFTSFGSSNWSRKHILRHIGILYHVFVHDGMIYLYSSPEPFSTLFSLHARVFSSMNCNIRNVLKPNPSLFLILTYHYSCHLETPNQPISKPKPWMPKDPRPWKKSTNSRAFQWRWSSRFPRRTGFCGWNSRSQQKVPRFDDFRWPWWTFQVLRMQHFCCPNWRCGWYAMPNGLLFVVDDLTTKKLGDK